MGSDAAGEERDGERRRMGETRLRVRLLFSLPSPLRGAEGGQGRGGGGGGWANKRLRDKKEVAAAARPVRRRLGAAVLGAVPTPGSCPPLSSPRCSPASSGGRFRSAQRLAPGVPAPPLPRPQPCCTLRLHFLSASFFPPSTPPPARRVLRRSTMITIPSSLRACVRAGSCRSLRPMELPRLAPGSGHGAGAPRSASNPGTKRKIITETLLTCFAAIVWGGRRGGTERGRTQGCHSRGLRGAAGVPSLALAVLLRRLLLIISITPPLSFPLSSLLLSIPNYLPNLPANVFQRLWPALRSARPKNVSVLNGNGERC